MSRKGKGMDAERELLHRFWGTGVWAALRVAGSGSMRYPAADVVATNGRRLLAIECKSSKDSSKYFSNEEISQLKEFSVWFQAEPWIGLKFDREEWYFMRVEELENSGKHLVASLKMAKGIGRVFERLVR